MRTKISSIHFIRINNTNLNICNIKYIYCDVAVPRASAEFLPNRVRREIARTVPQSPERRFCYRVISNPIGFSFIFFWYERMSTEAIEAEEKVEARLTTKLWKSWEKSSTD